MKHLRLLAFLYLLGIFLAGCVKDTIEFITDQDKKTTTNLFVQVTDEKQQPLEGATIQYQSKSFITNSYGIVIINGVDVSNRHSFATVSKQGYFTTGSVFRSFSNTMVQIHCIMKEKKFDYTFSTSLAQTVVTAEGVELSLPSNALQYQNSGLAYDGEVKMAVWYPDPALTTLKSEIPGELVGITSSNKVEMLTSYGVIQFEFQTLSGESLRIATGKKINAIIPIPSAQLGSAPTSLSMWYFDETTGYWKEEGTATRSGDKYTATISHLGAWNYSTHLPAIHISGRLLDQNGTPLQGVYVTHESAVRGTASLMGVNMDGTFSGLWPADKPITLKVFSALCPANELYSRELKASSDNIDVGKVVIDLEESSTMTLICAPVDCEQKKVIKGFASIFGWQYSKINIPLDQNGEVNVVIPVCESDGEAQMQLVDLNTNVTIDNIILNVPGINNLADVLICGNEPDFFMINCPSMEINNVLIYDGFQLRDSADFTLLSGTAAPKDVLIQTGIIYKDKVPGQYAAGNFQGTFVQLALREKVKLVSSELTLNITKGGKAGERIKGNFNGTITLQGEGGSRKINGEFLLKGQ